MAFVGLDRPEAAHIHEAAREAADIPPMPRRCPMSLPQVDAVVLARSAALCWNDVAPAVGADWVVIVAAEGSEAILAAVRELAGRYQLRAQTG